MNKTTITIISTLDIMTPFNLYNIISFMKLTTIILHIAKQLL